MKGSRQNLVNHFKPEEKKKKKEPPKNQPKDRRYTNTNQPFRGTPSRVTQTVALATTPTRTSGETHSTTPPRKRAKVSMLQPHSPVSMLSPPDWLPTLQHVHPSLEGLFPVKEVIAPQAGRTQKFLANWKLLTNDPSTGF